MDAERVALYELSEQVTEAVMAILAPTTPVWEETGIPAEGEGKSLILTEEARTVYEKVFETLEGDDFQW